MVAREVVEQELDRRMRQWYGGRRMWSSVYHGLGWSAILFAGLTTVGAALGWDKSWLVGLGAVTTAVTTATGLLRPAYKWRSHRLCHAEAERIQLYLMGGGSPDKALARLGTLITAHAQAIVGDAGTDISGTREAPDAPKPEHE
ncbi:MAG: hypothetical protein ABIW49_12775 [Knoellia sp.]